MEVPERPTNPMLTFSQNLDQSLRRAAALAEQWHHECATPEHLLLALTDDPDAPTGSGFWHWLIVNIPANVSELAEGAGSTGGKLPAGALQTRTDFGAPGHGGPCPPEGDHPHRYLFTVFAVKIDKLDVKADTSAAVVGFNLHFNTLARAEIMGLFKR